MLGLKDGRFGTAVKCLDGFRKTLKHSVFAAALLNNRRAGGRFVSPRIFGGFHTVLLQGSFLAANLYAYAYRYVGYGGLDEAGGSPQVRHGVLVRSAHA